eukprot:m.105645 g.105645  ORF g.105645 m.105645 type:complete len:128 (-) comp15731_c0_seq3:77-460(-)
MPAEHVFFGIAWTQPVFLRQDTPKEFQWRVRNMPYALDVYSVTVDSEKQQLVLRTTNKKYFKRFSVPDMERLGIELDQDAVSLAHANNTLIISYQKPPAVLALEKQLKTMRAGIKANQEGDVECAPS